MYVIQEYTKHSVFIIVFIIIYPLSCCFFLHEPFTQWNIYLTHTISDPNKKKRKHMFEAWNVQKWTQTQKENIGNRRQVSDFNMYSYMYLLLQFNFLFWKTRPIYVLLCICDKYAICNNMIRFTNKTLPYHKIVINLISSLFNIICDMERDVCAILSCVCIFVSCIEKLWKIYTHSRLVYFILWV